MILNAEHQKELAAFPPACLELIHAELAAGNSIAEVGHSFPAPPSGAYVRLAKVVSTRARDDGHGLSYRARNSSMRSGEYTNADRRYFIIEPPVEEAAQYPDMNVIRREHEPRAGTMEQIAERQASVARTPRAEAPVKDAEAKTSKKAASDHAYTATELPAGLIELLHFRDARPFHEVQFALERKLTTLFTGGLVKGLLCMRAEANVNGARYVYNLQLEDALPATNCYSFRAEGLWAHHGAEHDDYFRTTSRSWFKFRTDDLTPANPPEDAKPSSERYASVTEAAIQAEAHLNSVAAIQQAIVAGLKAGGEYSTSHKEGGTIIAWKRGAFVRESYGDDSSVDKLADEGALLKALWHFCEGEITRHAVNNTVPELDMWRLIWRRMQTHARPR